MAVNVVVSFRLGEQHDVGPLAADDFMKGGGRGIPPLETVTIALHFCASGASPTIPKR